MNNSFQGEVENACHRHGGDDTAHCAAAPQSDGDPEIGIPPDSDIESEIETQIPATENDAKMPVIRHAAPVGSNRDYPHIPVFRPVVQGVYPNHLDFPFVSNFDHSIYLNGLLLLSSI